MTTHGNLDERVVDELAIRDLVNRYADATTRRDARGVAATFTAEGEWLAKGHGHLRGREEMIPRFTELQAPFTAFLHTLLSGYVHLDPGAPDRASGRWYMMEMGKLADGTDVTVWGVYHDDYVRDAGEWRISRRRFDPLFSRKGEGLTAIPFPADVPGTS